MSLFLVALLAGATASPAPPPPRPARPRLVVMVVVDQMRADYVDRFGHQWTKGLRRLFDQGAVFTQAAYPYLGTVTCAGHATVSTGTFPRTHGIVQNTWWDRSLGRSVSCTEDPAASMVPFGRSEPRPGGDSPHRLRVPTFTDELRAQAAVAPRIAVVSLKARSAIMLAGHRGDVVLWLGMGPWTTSSAFASEPSPVIAEIAAAAPPLTAPPGAWDRLKPAATYLFKDDASGEHPPAGWTGTFPHPLPAAAAPSAERYALWTTSPFADDAVGELAAAAVSKLGLGKGPGTDVLGLSFSALDIVGHSFGPQSHEVQDVLLRLDGTLGRLLDHLDRSVGRGQYVLALTADHGVSLIPEAAARSGLDAGRVDGALLKDKLETVLVGALGPGPHVDQAQYTDVYLKAGVLERLQDKPATLEALVAAAESVPGVARAFVGEALRLGLANGDPLAHSAALSYVPGRSGDLVILPRPHWITSTAAATHGTPYGYDARVPLVLFGAGVRPGPYVGSATPADVAPTLAYLCGITLPRPDGRALTEALTSREPVR